MMGEAGRAGIAFRRLKPVLLAIGDLLGAEVTARVPYGACATWPSRRDATARCGGPAPTC